MNEDTIALSYGEDGEYFLDTGTNPLRFRPLNKIDKSKNFWLKPTFWSKSPGESLRTYKGDIGFRTWPGENTIRHSKEWSYRGAQLYVERNKTYKFWNDLVVEKDGNESIILRDKGGK